MAITDNKYIAVAYKLYALEDGNKEMIEEATIDRPFQFISDLGTTLPAFELGVKDLKKGESFSLTLTKDQAYGDYNEEHVLELPKHIFEVDGKFDNEHIFPGNIVPLMDEDGRTLNGAVLEVKDDIVVMDMNHPLAGSDIVFEGSVVETRPATTEEIQGMVNMITGEGGGCGCGCGSSDDCGCGSSDNEGGCGCNSGGCGSGCC
ncbi:peptidylprolyl isomerase FKBP-type [Bacteroides coprosuis DSM 18011]|uniref:Peptidyl-prolyl cis-trans isomerase n=1 Tax=Bacteroides coprosuis DSM 18011 TaxID=679937 RepID=F3ZP76_9BACE|nr:MULTISPECIES: FKBP-type peptidyl-prolyl cis-trans isomerase [Bacteroides]EGJ70303.1 peptidylprolyl isomerase FKBP-type [Bacteroides coprosuis DSM 18011]HJD93326.1 FKBP-type peptidyl-prolyl cis-trans isomerase [Bacteroides coprosuis]